MSRLMFMPSRFAVCIGTQLEFPVFLIDTRTYLHPIYLIYCTALDLSSPSPPTRTSTTHPRHTSAPHLRRHLLLPRFVWASPTHARFFVCRLLKSCRPSCPSVVEQSCEFFFFETMIPRNPNFFLRNGRGRGLFLLVSADADTQRPATTPDWRTPHHRSVQHPKMEQPLLRRSPITPKLLRPFVPNSNSTDENWIGPLGSTCLFGCLSPFVDLSSGSSFAICASRKLESRSSRRSSTLCFWLWSRPDLPRV